MEILADPSNLHQTRLHELHRLATARHGSQSMRYADFLDTGRRLLGMPTGMVSHIEAASYRVLAVSSPRPQLRVGEVYPLSTLYCDEIVERRETVAHAHVGADARARHYPAYLSTRLECFIGAPLWVHGEIYGTLSFSDTVPRDTPFTDADLDFIELLALALAGNIERELDDREREQTRWILDENIALFESAFHSAAIGMALVGTEGRYLKVNAALCELMGYPEAELLLQDFQTLTHPDDLTLDLELLQELAEGRRPNYRMEKRYLRKDGAVVWTLLSVSMIRDRSGRPRYFVSQIQDITERKLAEAELIAHRRRLEIANVGLTELASIDPLTGLGNRRAFNRKLEDAVTTAHRDRRPVSLLMIDVDHFKRYNDSHGHPAGDAALRAVARCLLRGARESDFVARYGGEEFVVLLPDTEPGTAFMIAERLRHAIASIDTERQPITASIGVTTALPGEDDTDADLVRLVSAADVALYHAKRDGRNRVVCSGDCDR